MAKVREMVEDIEREARENFLKLREEQTPEEILENLIFKQNERKLSMKQKMREQLTRKLLDAHKKHAE